MSAPNHAACLLAGLAREYSLSQVPVTALRVSGFTGQCPDAGRWGAVASVSAAVGVFFP